MISLTINFIATEQNLPDLQSFYCTRCRGMLFKTNRNFATIFTGDGYPPTQIPKAGAWIELKCRNCPTLYNFYYQ